MQQESIADTNTSETEHRNTERLIALIREGRALSFGQQVRLAALLSVPAMIAQLSSIVMQYIDASMVGSLGANASAAIGLVSTTTWLFWGLCSACAMGFSVQVAHRIGAGDMHGARSVVRQALTATGFFGILVGAVGVAISGALPRWLGGDPVIHDEAATYFFIYSIFLPMMQLNFLAGGMLRCSGNMKVPSILGVLMCVLDVIFNFLFIFPSRTITVFGLPMHMPGLGLGVEGAALGTVAAETIVAVAMLWYMWTRSGQLKLTHEKGSFIPEWSTLKKAMRIGLPMGVEHVVICGAQIMTTVIVAPLGVFAIAANSFGVTAESLCYMPGYGIAEAATTLTGQSIGAGRRRLTLRFAWLTVGMGMTVMAFMGALMYIFAPEIIGFMSPVIEIRELGVTAMRIEAFAEPMFAASIVAYGVFVGAGSTMMPCIMNFFSIWAVRITLAALLAPSMGLDGVWLAMCIELCFRGVIFLLWLRWGKWMRKI